MKIIYLLIGLSFIYSQCNDYSQTQCSNDDNCDWVEDIELENCYFAWSESNCQAHDGCEWECEMIWDSSLWQDVLVCDCYGQYQVDAGYCQEIEMPECSEMSQSECSSNGSCDWVEDIDWGSCADLDPIWNVVYYCDDPLTNLDNCYTYTCYGGGYGQWGTCCGGDPYIISDNSYCEEVEMPECSEMDILQCNLNDSCNWIEDIDYGNCSSLSDGECNSYEGCYLQNNYPGWYDGSWTCEGGTYQIDNSYCEESSVPEYQLGDVNQDNTINIQDVIVTVNLVLNNEWNYLVDMNDDHRIDILDIIELVNIILN